MEITEEFIENSILSEWLSKTIEEDGSDEFFSEIIQIFFFEDIERHFEMLLQIIDALKHRSCTEARKFFKNNGEFSYFAEEMPGLRKTLKSLMSGLIKTSAIVEVSEIEQYKNYWKDYDVFDKNSNSEYYHHTVVYQQFKEVKSMEELQKFNEFFHHYLIEMAFKMCEIFFRRMTYTIEYLQNDEGFKEACREATVNLNNFRNEIEKLKRVPLFINHRGTENT